MSNDKAPTYKQYQDGWLKVSFEELEPGDIIKMYNDPEETELRGGRYWKVTSEPYLYEEDNMGVEAEPMEKHDDSEVLNE